ncbi:AraC family transcriptional regulator [Marinobacter sp. CHS3-4]|uniref:AraC family transcriptional regulator n=1 Tax=Marinobacter sp. CHS3-4 TaxID=3045174 RepID=UPI0024B56B03|nr:AraC family transcriptional regulator [Marinobacter sp. CHS3-4]MDI9244637.1 AraC family transcriptional regulator ligand-binding domain-containing protein [Marinobacter sp. CHS3-4]
MGTRSRPTVSSALVLDLYDGLAEQGFAFPSDLEAIGVTRDALLDADYRPPAIYVETLWQLAHQRRAPDHIGLLVGGRMHDGAKGVLSNLALTTATLREAILLFLEYLPVMSEIETIEAESDARGLRLVYGYRDAAHYHQAAISRSMSAGVTWASYLTGTEVRPVKTGFRQRAVANPDRYRAMFGDGCVFGAEADYLVVSHEDLARPVLSSNQLVKKILLEKAESIRETLNRNGCVSQAVEAVIEDNLHRGVVTSAFVAAQLDMSRQTMHRKLSAEGLNFTTLMSRVRQAKARYYLQNKRCNVDELSVLLGYSEPSAFYKAFKSWFDTTPRRFSSA